MRPRSILVHLTWWEAIVVSSFRPEQVFLPSPQRYRTSTANAFAVPSSSSSLQARSNGQTEQEETLSDVDSRVLQSMLQDSKVDLTTEDDIRKLLERGTVKTVKQPEKREEESDSEYDSSVIKAFTDTKLWKKLSAKANDVAESVGIWVANKVEADVKVLAALGLFAWDRAVRDVGRALPAAGTSARKILLLSNSSSFVEPEKPNPADNVRERMNKPADEIQSVSRAILDILKGDTTAGTGRGLRTAAPAGSANMAERQQRAYTQRKKIEKQEKDVTRVAGAVVDTAYELGRELKAESNPAGYKSENVRNAIEAGIANTGNLLRGIQESARLAAAERKSTRLAAAQPEPIDRDQVLVDLQAERLRINERLKNCIKNPEDTWLSADFVEEGMEFDEDGLRDVVTMMIFIRDEVEEIGSGDDLDALISELGGVRKSAEELRGRIATAASYDIAEVLWNEIFPVQSDGQPALTLRLADLEEQLNAPPPPILIAEDDAVDVQSVETAETDDRPPFWAAVAEPFSNINNVATHASEDNMDSSSWSEGVVEESSQWLRDSGNVFDNDIADESSPVAVEVQPEVVTATVVSATVVSEPDVDQKPFTASEVSRSQTQFDVDPNFSVEVVTDDDFEAAVGQTAAVAEVSEDEEEAENKEPNIATKAVLRTLDVVLFVLEKTLTVGIPRTLNAGKVASTRLAEINREGRGTDGWQILENAVNAKGRY